MGNDVGDPVPCVPVLSPEHTHMSLPSPFTAVLEVRSTWCGPVVPVKLLCIRFFLLWSWFGGWNWLCRFDLKGRQKEHWTLRSPGMKASWHTVGRFSTHVLHIQTRFRQDWLMSSVVNVLVSCWGTSCVLMKSPESAVFWLVFSGLEVCWCPRSFQSQLFDTIYKCTTEDTSQYNAYTTAPGLHIF